MGGITAAGAAIGVAESVGLLQLGRVLSDKILDGRANFSSEGNKKIAASCVLLLSDIAVDLVDYLAPSASANPLYTGFKIGSVAAQLIIAAKFCTDPQSGQPAQSNFLRANSIISVLVPSSAYVSILHLKGIPLTASVATAAAYTKLHIYCLNKL